MTIRIKRSKSQIVDDALWVSPWFLLGIRAKEVDETTPTPTPTPTPCDTCALRDDHGGCTRTACLEFLDWVDK